MGCDIHAYVEYQGKVTGSPYWKTVGKRINPGRDYDLFAKLAGVRNYGDEIIPLSEPRGLPEQKSLTVLWDDQLYVTDDEELANGEEWCLRETAESWVASGCSHWVREDKSAVSHPDHHSHSYCSPAELRKVFEEPRKWPVDVEWWVVLTMLEELERRNCEARLVFWFDN